MAPDWFASVSQDVRYMQMRLRAGRLQGAPDWSRGPHRRMRSSFVLRAVLREFSSGVRSECAG